LTFARGAQSLAELDLATGAMTTLFDPPDSAWLNAAAVSPDGAQLALAYAAPPPEGEITLGFTDLYLMPMGHPDQMQLVLQRTDAQESFFNPAWSPDGRQIYYSHLVHIAPTTNSLTPTPFDAINYQYNIERIAYPPGSHPPESLIENAIWPRLSPDGSKIAYVSFDLNTYANNLYVADADGTHATQLTTADTFSAVDAPIFAADGQTILFSAVGGPIAVPSSSSLTWLDQLLGVQIASAHNVPSDWWRISVNGGQPSQITQLYDTGLYAALSPDGQRMAFVAASGLYIMNPDGSDLRQLLRLWVGGTIDWIP
jgi:Tol biopolymer transport system component